MTLALASQDRGDKAHEHRWDLRLHMDGCHWYRSAYGCVCGASFHTYDERSTAEDPWSAVWMEEPCQRCAELLHGANAAHLAEYVP